jgi:hypothetical protein
MMESNSFFHFNLFCIHLRGLDKGKKRGVIFNVYKKNIMIILNLIINI